MKIMKTIEKSTKDYEMSYERGLAIRQSDCFDSFTDEDAEVIMGNEIHRLMREWTKPEIELVTKIINDVVDSEVITNFEKGKVEIAYEDKFGIFSAKIKNFYNSKKLKDVFVMVAPPYEKAQRAGSLCSKFRFTLLGWSEKDDRGVKKKYEFVKTEIEERLPSPILKAFMRLWEQIDENKYQILMKNKELGNIYGIDVSELN